MLPLCQIYHVPSNNHELAFLQDLSHNWYSWACSLWLADMHQPASPHQSTKTAPVNQKEVSSRHLLNIGLTGQLKNVFHYVWCKAAHQLYIITMYISCIMQSYVMRRYRVPRVHQSHQWPCQLVQLIVLAIIYVVAPDLLADIAVIDWSVYLTLCITLFH